MKQLTPSERVTLVIVGIAVLAGGVAPTAAPDALGTALMYDAGVLAAATFALAGTLRLSPERRGDWWFVPVAVSLFFAGDVALDIYSHILHRAAPLPSSADALRIAAYVLVMVGTVRLVRRRTDIDLLNAVFDTGMLGMAIALLVWEPLLVDSGRSLLGALTAGAYPVFDIMLVGFAAVLVGNRRMSQSTLLLFGGAGVLFIADLSFLIAQSTGRYASGGWPDPLFVIGPFLFAAAPWFDVATDPDDPAARRHPRPVAGTIVVIASLVALPIDFGLTDAPEGTSDELVVRTLLRVLLLAFVAARLVRQALRNESLVHDLDRLSTRLTMVIENTTDAVVFTSADGTVIDWNAAAENLFGFQREEIVGKNVLEYFVRPENAATVRGVMADLARGGTREFTLHLEPHGESVAVTMQVAAVLDAQHNVLGFVTVARDDTRRLLTRHVLESFAQLEPAPALAKFASQLRAFIPFDVLSLAAVEQGRYRELARVTADLQAVETLSGGPLADYKLENLAAGIAESIALPLADALTGETRGLLALGFASAGAMTNAHAETLARIAPEVSQSVNNMLLYERERLTAERLQELDDLREGFFAMVAHEVRSPLGAIGTAAAVLRDHGDTIDTDAARELAAGISTGARRLARLTGDLVDASRGGHGTFPCEMAPIDDVSTIVTTAAGAAAGTQRDRVQVEVSPGIPLVGDVDRVAQIVTNLVTNALKFSDGPVDVCLRRDGDEAVLSVADHGPGIPAAHEHRLFQRFTRLPINGDGPHPSGTGLGLFITRELALAHHGSIRHVPTPGGGATFEVRLPCCA